MATDAGRVTFDRTLSAGPLGAVLAAIGAVAFLGGAIWTFVGTPFPWNLLAAGIFGFFGVLMGLGAITGLARRSDSRAVEVSAEGLWLPEMGSLRWAEIAEVRIEAMRGIGSSDAPVTTRIRRLGVVPRDPMRRAAPATTTGWRMAMAYYGFVKRIAPELRLGIDDPAPFGVAENEMAGTFDELVAAVRAHADVIDAEERRARQHAPRWGGDGSEGGGGAHATFGLPPTRTLDVVFMLIPVVGPLAIVVPVLVPMIVQGGPQALVSGAVLMFVVLGFGVPGLRSLSGIVRRYLARREGADRLRVGPEGIWLKDLGDVRWAQVAEVRTARGGWVRRIGTPSVERWVLEVSTAPDVGPVRIGRLASDELDASFDDVLDVVRLYHPVVETG